MEGFILRKVSREFNKWRSPECKVKVLKNRGNNLTVEFTGTRAGFACCFDENFVDYVYYLEDIGKKKFEVSQIKRKDKERFVVNYKLKEA